MTEHDDGEQGPATDGLAAKSEWLMVGLPGGPGGLSAQWAEEALSATTPAPVSGDSVMIAFLEARIARKEDANEALVQRMLALEMKHEATMADMRSLQRRNEEWATECQRLSSLLIENERKLAQRMAIPANALKHGGVR